MDKGKIAESFMSLVMERSRAATVIGDLLETEAASGEGWFWVHVIRTWFGTVWSDTKSEPRFILGMAALGSVISWFITVLAEFVFLFSERMARTWILPHLSLHSEPSRFFGQLQMLTAVFAGSFYAGQWIARYSLGREIAVCCAMAIVDPVISFGLGVSLWLLLNVGHGFLGAETAPAFTVGSYAWFVYPLIPFFLGAAWARRQRQTPRAI